MGSFFSYDSPLMNFLTKMADLIILNILAIICCIPIFTIGASVTALHYVALKIVRNEEYYVTKYFFKSFKQNFKQATIIWLIMLLMFGVVALLFLSYVLSGTTLPRWWQITMLVMVLLILFVTIHVFPLLSRFENPVSVTYKNSVFMGILVFPKTIAMMACWVLPYFIIWNQPKLVPIIFFFGISGPVFLNAYFYNSTFKRFEPKEEEEEKDPDAWFIEEEEPENNEMTEQENQSEIEQENQSE